MFKDHSRVHYRSAIACLIVSLLLTVPAAAEDEAAALYKKARSALSEDGYRKAAELYGELIETFPESDYAGDALYWRAFSLYRLGEDEDLRAALESLTYQRENHLEAATLGDAVDLEARIYGELAKRGDRESDYVISILADEDGDFLLTQENCAIIQREAALAQKDIQREWTINQREWELNQQDWERSQRDWERQQRAWERGQGLLSTIRIVDDKGHISICRMPHSRHKESDIRIAALNALVEMDPDRATPAIQKVLARRDEESAQLRTEALFLLTRIESEDADDLLLDAAKNDPDPGVQAEAVMLLSSVSTESAIAVIDDIVRNSTDERIQESAAYALYHHPSPRAAELLRDFATDPTLSREVRRGSIVVLGEKKSPETLKFLMELYDDVSAEAFREEIVVSISRFGSDESRRWLLDLIADDKNLTSVRETALSMLMGDSDVRTRDLVEIYDTVPDIELRKTAIWLLSKKGDSAADQKLIEIAKEEKNAELRLEAVRWMSQTDDPRAIEILEELIGE